jgi:hypothetical protein
MKLRLATSTLLVLGVACSHPQRPPLASLPAAARDAASARCQQAFPEQPWRATHTLLATLPLGYNGGLVGVLAVGADGLHAVLLSPEGITLFDGIQKRSGSGGLAILRAVPPFDRSDFAAALLADVGNAFLPPGREPSEVGRGTTGETTCRWLLPNHAATEVDLLGERPARIRTYRGPTLTRQIELRGSPERGFYPQVQLVVPGPGGYTLDMSLVDHE